MPGGSYGAYGSTITGYYAEFPSPLEVNGSSYKHSYDEELQSGSFPSSPEVAGGSYKVYDAGMPAEFEFPSPPEVTEGSY